MWCHFLGDHLGKNGDKTSCNNGPKKNQLLSFCLELMIVWADRGQICWKSKSIEIHKQFGMAAHTYPHSQTFFYVRFTWHRPLSPPSLSPSLPPRALSTDRQSGWESHITVPHCSLPHHFHYIVILNYQQRWTGKDDWHIPASGAATAWLSGVSWQAPLHAVPDGRGPAKCLAKGLH